MWGWISLEQFFQDVRFSIRMLRKNPMFSAVAIATLALGIGANTAIFSVVDHVILRPLAYHDSGRLCIIHEHISGIAAKIPPLLPVNAMHFSEWRQNSRSFDQMSLIGGIELTLTGVGAPQRLDGARVSWNFFGMLGIKPQLGRTFLPEEDAPGRDHEIILNYGVWKTEFASDPNIIGRKVVLGGEPYEVVGVLPASFHFPELRQLYAMDIPEPRPEIWKPFAVGKEDLNAMGSFNFSCIAKLKAGVSTVQAESELNALQAQIAKRVPFHVSFSAMVQALQRQITSRARMGLELAFGAVIVLLLIASVNLASLLLSRATVRKREMAIRSAIGGSGARLLRQLLAESLTLTLAGGAVGVALAYGAVHVIVAQAPADIPRMEEVGIDARVLLFTLGLSILTGLLFGLAPSWSAVREDPQEAMKGSGRGTTEARRAGRARELLVAAEVCLSTVCLVSGGLLLHSFIKLMDVDKGFQTDRLITVDLDVPDNRYPSTEKRAAMLHALLERVRNLPGVTDAAIANMLPLTGEGDNNIVTTAEDKTPLVQRPLADLRMVSPDYFRTIGIPLRAGRAFTDEDHGHNVVLVSALTAAKLWPGRNPVGHEMVIGDDDKHPLRVLGIAGDVRANIEHQPMMTIYVPYWQRDDGVTLTVKTPASESAAAREIRAAIWATDPELSANHFQTMLERLDNSVAQRRFQMELVVLFAFGALLLASLGIYGVVAYSVAQRTNEIGVRMALGAERTTIGNMVLRQGLGPVAIGLAIGLVGSLAAGRLIAGLLFEIQAADPLTIAAVAIVLLVVATAAIILPAIRATRVNPLQALRYE